MWISKEELMKMIEEKIPEEGCSIMIDKDDKSDLVFSTESCFPQRVVKTHRLNIHLSMDLDKIFPEG